jgi:hypothetical protein
VGSGNVILLNKNSLVEDICVGFLIDIDREGDGERKTRYNLNYRSLGSSRTLVVAVMGGHWWWLMMVCLAASAGSGEVWKSRWWDFRRHRREEGGQQRRAGGHGIGVAAARVQRISLSSLPLTDRKGLTVLLCVLAQPLLCARIS